MKYIPVFYNVNYENPNVIYLTDKYINHYYKKIPYTQNILGDYFDEIISSLLKPNEFMLYSVEPDNILTLIRSYQLGCEFESDLMELLKLYILCIPLNTILISSLIYKNNLLQYLIINDPYFSAQLLDYNVYNSFTESINIKIKYDFYTNVAFNELTEVFFRDYLGLKQYGVLEISPIQRYQFERFNDYLSDVIIDQGKTKTKSIKYMQMIDDFFLTDLKDHNLSAASLLSIEDYNSYIHLLSTSSSVSNQVGIGYLITDFFKILTHHTSRDTTEIIRIIRNKIKEVIFNNNMDAPIEYTDDFIIRSIADIYMEISKEIYYDIASYLFQSEISELGVFYYIPKENILEYLSNLVLYEYLGFVNWVISKSIGCYEDDKFIHRISTYMQYCIINKEVLLNANHS